LDRHVVVSGRGLFANSETEDRTENCTSAGRPLYRGFNQVPAAVIAISMLVALVMGTPSKASQQCMSKAEARQHFGSAHICWHGAG
jgi:hypothetical protein